MPTGWFFSSARELLPAEVLSFCLGWFSEAACGQALLANRAIPKATAMIQRLLYIAT